MEKELNHIARFLKAALPTRKKLGSMTFAYVGLTVSLHEHFLLNKSTKNLPNTSMTGMLQLAANFLRKYGLIDEFKLNTECNHATISSHRFAVLTCQTQHLRIKYC